jgi:glycosyltransferase involved in cell wall biosynthesis
MKIGIDISQVAYEGTGTAGYLKGLVEELLKIDNKNEYILFFSSLRRKFLISNFKFLNKSQIQNSNFKIRVFKFPPTLLDILWNRLHILPIEWLIGDVDVFITSDWTEPPTRRAKKATILYDLTVYKYPNETDKKIVATQKRKLEWVKKESDVIFCISESTKKDAMEILNIGENRLKVIYPGI